MTMGDKGGAVAYLVGAENGGMAAMFTMMNQARLGVGLQGVGIADRAYQRALAYAQERKQGKARGSKGDGSDPIIMYPDVKRNLMLMRGMTAAARTICYATAVAIDVSHRATDPKVTRQGRSTRCIADADGEGLLHRHRQRGRGDRRAGAWRHGLHGRNRRGAICSRFPYSHHL